MEKGTRINQYIAKTGLASRRKSEALVLEGKIKINGEIATLGSRVFDNDKVTYMDNPISIQDEIWIAMYKPKGIICTSSPKERPNIIEYLGFGSHIFPVGRLDKDSEGLILLTTNGEYANRMSKARFYHEKEYLVKVNQKLKNEDLERLSQGIPILDTITRKCHVEKVNDYSFKIILTQGLNRQIRRMCEYLGLKVVFLKRIRIMDIFLSPLKYGEYRYLRSVEIEKIKKELECDKTNG